MSQPLSFVALVALLAGCSNPTMGAEGSPCPPSNEALLAGPGAPGSQEPFTYEILEQPPEGADPEIDVVQTGAYPMRIQANNLVVSFQAEPVEMTLPEGNLPGIQAHHALIEPVLRDFNLEVVRQSRIPLDLQPVQIKPDGSVQTPPPVSRWMVQPSFLVRVVDAESEPLTELVSDATVLGLRGKWTFERPRTAGLFARYFSLLRRKDCYGIQAVSPNSIASPASLP